MNNKSYSLEIEQAVLGCIIKHNESYDLVSENLTIDDFYFANNRDIYSTIVSNSKENIGIDIVSLHEKMEMNGFEDKFSLMGEIAKNAPSPHSLAGHCKFLYEKRKERSMIAALASSINSIQSGEYSTQEALRVAIANVSAIDPDDDNENNNAKHVRDIGSEWLNVYDNRINNPESAGITVGVEGLDDIIGLRGQQAGDLVVIAGRPKMGKSLLSVKISNHIALNLNKPVLSFSMEMTDISNYERILTQETGISNESFYRNLNDHNLGEVGNTITQLNGSNYWIDDRPNLSFDEMKKEARKLSAKYGGYKGLGGIFIDYFTLMDIGDNVKNSTFEYAGLSKKITALGKELGCPIFLLAQLNRDCEKRNDKRPMPSDLGDTGQLERDASMIIMLYREEVYIPDTPMKGLTELIISVNRNGKTGSAFQTMINGRFADICASEAGSLVAESEYQNKMKKQNEGFNDGY